MVDVVVIGAGQAGLSGAYHLRRAGLEPERDFVVLDHSPRPGGAWQFRWPSLTYGKVHGMHALPGMELTGADDDRPSSEVIGAYFDSYERAFDLRVHRPVDVGAVREGDGGRLLVETSEGTYATRALINATGTWDRPFWPRYPGQESFRGRQLHTADYPGPDAFAGRRVVVVGGGASGTQHLMEIAEVAAETYWVTRRPPVFREGPFDQDRGRAAVALVEERVRRGLPPQSVVSVTGLPLNDAVRRARAEGVLDRLPMFDRITPTGVAWDDGRTIDADVILWATGFRAAIDHLAPLRLREPGGGIGLDGTRAVRDARVHLVGYGPSASTIGANRAGRAAVREITRLLGTPPTDVGHTGTAPETASVPETGAIHAVLPRTRRPVRQTAQLIEHTNKGSDVRWNA
ncbi:NAD(P)-binding domain-containing protein [Streptomyces sp. NPDC001455]|uniref:NAD(P)-binding domain-containing protein n=1 Tax=unclassified Streptomyces TaxID=2593676 RepID=UPI00331D6BA1